MKKIFSKVLHGVVAFSIVLSSTIGPPVVRAQEKYREVQEIISPENDCAQNYHGSFVDNVCVQPDGTKVSVAPPGYQARKEGCESDSRFKFYYVGDGKYVCDWKDNPEQVIPLERGNTSNSDQGSAQPSLVPSPSPAPEPQPKPVLPDVTVSVTATPQKISAGESTTIKWDSKGATSCTINGTSGYAVSDSLSETLTTSKTYTVSCANAQKSGFADVTVSVTQPEPQPNPPPQPDVSVEIEANPTTVVGDEQTTISWKSTGATKCVLDGIEYAANGKLDVHLDASKTFTIYCSNSEKNGVDDVTVIHTPKQNTNTDSTSLGQCLLDIQDKHSQALTAAIERWRKQAAESMATFRRNPTAVSELLGFCMGAGADIIEQSVGALVEGSLAALGLSDIAPVIVQELLKENPAVAVTITITSAAKERFDIFRRWLAIASPDLSRNLESDIGAARFIIDVAPVAGVVGKTATAAKTADVVERGAAEAALAAKTAGSVAKTASLVEKIIQTGTQVVDSVTSFFKGVGQKIGRLFGRDVTIAEKAAIAEQTIKEMTVAYKANRLVSVTKEEVAKVASEIKWSKISKPVVRDPKLMETVNQLYKDKAWVGNKSTADAIRVELKTGKLVEDTLHFDKGKNRIGNLRNWIEAHPNSPEIGIAQSLIDDLTSALAGN